MDIRLSVMDNEKCPIEVKKQNFGNSSEFARYIHDKNINVRLNFVYYEECPIEIKEKIFSSLSEFSESSWIAFIVLMSDYAKVEDLTTYSKSKLWLERYAIAQNKKTPIETLKILAQDANRIVRATAKERLENISM